jgi:hypothetical protein
MKKFFQKQREVLTVVAYVGFVVLLVCFVIFPLLKKISNVADNAQRDILDHDIVRQRVNEIPRMQQQYQLVEKNENILDVLLDENEAVQLIEELEKIAQDSQNTIVITMQEQDTGMKMLDTTKNKKDEEKTVLGSLPSQEYLQMKIELKGDYNSIIKFIDFLENLEYYCDIVAIQMRNADSSEYNRRSELVDPFEESDPSSIQPEESQDIKKNIECIIDVVFYTKNEL